MLGVRVKVRRKKRGGEPMPRIRRVRGRTVVSVSERVLDHLKTEIAREFGYASYDMMDRGSLTAKENGAIGGEVVRRLIRYAEAGITNGELEAALRQGGK
jgi:hypothetical protein